MCKSPLMEKTLHTDNLPLSRLSVPRPSVKPELVFVREGFVSKVVYNYVIFFFFFFTSDSPVSAVQNSVMGNNLMN